MKQNKVLNKHFELGDHLFEIMHPTQNSVYEKSSWTLFCTTAEFDKTFTNFYPPMARLFVDGVNQGTLEDLLED